VANYALASLVSRSGDCSPRSEPLLAFNRNSGFNDQFPDRGAKPVRFTMELLYQLSYNGNKFYKTILSGRPIYGRLMTAKKGFTAVILRLRAILWQQTSADLLPWSCSTN
jgi:hypothetical protein